MEGLTSELSSGDEDHDDLFTISWRLKGKLGKTYRHCKDQTIIPAKSSLKRSHACEHP